MLSLAARKTDTGKRADLGRFSHATSPAGLMYRAFQQGEVNAAQNLALTLFYAGDLDTVNGCDVLQGAATRMLLKN